jgi:hypothetical protein
MEGRSVFKLAKMKRWPDFRIDLASALWEFPSGGMGVEGTPCRRSSERALPGTSTPATLRLRRRTRSMTPSRHAKIRGIQKKRYNKEILKPIAGSVWFFHAGDPNPG